MNIPEPLNSHYQVPIQLITSQRGKPMLLRARYRYDLKRRNKDQSTVWRCVKRQTCHAILVLTSKTIIKREDSHKCQLDYS